MNYADTLAAPKLKISSLIGASSTTLLSFSALVSLMAPPVASMMMGS